MVADLTKHLFTLGPEAIEEIAAILQVTVAPSTTTQSTAQLPSWPATRLERLKYHAHRLMEIQLPRHYTPVTQSRRIVRRKDASWSLNWPSGANLLARKQHMYFFWCLCDYCVLVFLCYWESIN